MKYMLIMNTPRDGYTQYMNWPKKILEANAAFMQAFTKKLIDAGELVGAEGLASPDQAKLVRAGRTESRSPTVSSPSSRSSSRGTGSWTSTAPSARCRSPRRRRPPGAEVTGADGKPITHLWIEVRQILGSHQDL